MAKQGYEVVGLEYYIPDIKMVKERSVRADAAHMPFKDKTFDMLFSAETMEHIEPDISDDVLREMGRVAGTLFLTIATRDDPPFHSHINIHDGLWWANKFHELGFRCVNIQIPPSLLIKTENTDEVYSWPDGVYIAATN